MICNGQHLNITMGTDVVLRDTLIFDGETFDPALSTGITANLVSSLGKRTPLAVEVADGGLIIYVPWVERNAGYYGLEVTGTCNSKKWATYADSLIHYTRATEMGVAEVTIESDYYDITQVVGYRYSTSPIDSVTATVDDGIGTPSVEYQYDGKDINFDFHNLKGQPFTYADLTPEQKAELKGEKGDPGDSVIVGEGDLPLSNQVNYDNDKATTPRAVKEALTYTEIEITLPSPTSSEETMWINGDDEWAPFIRTGKDKGIVVPATPGRTYKVVTNNASRNARYAWLKDNERINGQHPHYCNNCTQELVDPNNTIYITAPIDANYIYFRWLTSEEDVRPSHFCEQNFIVDVIKDIEADVNLNELIHVGTFYGTIEVMRGTMTSGSASTQFYRKFEIEDTSRKYYATYRMFPNANDVCGVAFYDANNNFICSQYSSSGSSTAVTREKRLLSIPANTKYVYVLGADTDNSAIGYVIPRLYISGELDKADNTRLKEVARFAMLGAGENNVTSKMIPANGNTHFIVKMEYGSWTMPDPTATTGGFVIRDLMTESPVSYVANTGWMQKDFDNPTEAEFITRPIALGFRFSFRAAEGEVVNFVVYEVDEIGDATIYGTPPANVMLYNISKVNTTPAENADGSSYISSNMVDSAWAVMFPTSYKATGKPTQVIAMLHGAAGYVSPDVMGYTMQKWINWRDQYLSAGYAIMEINGWGISASSDHKSRHWGCPAALETIDKAFDTIRHNYNVEQKIMLHGSSMGGATSWAYALSHPNKVAAVGLFSPATLSWIMLEDRSLENNYTIAIEDWQYANAEEAIADDFQRIVGYDPIIRALRYKDGAYAPVAQLAGLDVLQYSSSEYTLVGQALPFPVRIWHGDADPTVPISLSQIITDAYRRGGQLVTLRTCPGETHAICTGGTQYVCDEALDFFDTYKQ